MAKSSYVGKAGQLAAMAEFLLRGYNVAMPEVDEGDDIFVVEDRSGRMWRVQVKTAIAQRRKAGWRATYSVSYNQLRTEKVPDLFYVLALRREMIWEFLLIGRNTLREEVTIHHVGSRSDSNVLLAVTFQNGSAACSGQDWSQYLNDWSEWPVVIDEH